MDDDPDLEAEFGLDEDIAPLTLNPEWLRPTKLVQR